MDATVRRRWTVWEPAPAGRAPDPPGWLRGADGDPLHGFWSAAASTRSALVVAANHGTVLGCWLVPLRDWRAASPLLRLSNALLPSLPWVWAAQQGLWSSAPPDTAIALVLAGRKPAARAETLDAQRAREWVAAAADAGFAVRHDTAPVPGELRRSAGRSGAPPEASPLEPPSLHVVSVARHEQFGQLFDLDGLLSDLAGCGVDRTTLDTAAVELALLDGLHVADLLDLDWFDADRPDADWPDADRRGWAGAGVGSGRPAAAQADSPGSGGRGVARSVRVGLMLGHHPALLAGALLGLRVGHRLPLAAAVVSGGDVRDAAQRGRTAALPGLRAFGGPLPDVATAAGWGGAE